MIAILLPLTAACSETQLPTTMLDVDGHAVIAEVADTTKAREQGLMGRKFLGDDEGMIFVYTDEKPRSFWMKNTPLPLSIAYADKDGKIVKILDMEPYSEDRVQSIYPAQYALEMKQGWFTEHGVESGDRIGKLPTATPAPAPPLPGGEPDEAPSGAVNSGSPTSGHAP